MSWFPIGPDFVFAPRNANFKRLSRRNEAGRQGLDSCIIVDQSDPTTIYVCERPSSGGTSAFRTTDEGSMWTPIADVLQQTNPNIDPMWIAVNPSHPETIYMATYSDGAVYVSGDRGDTWGARNAVGGNVRKLLVDPRTAGTLATTVVYAATNNGVYRSPDGGVNWVQVLPGDVWSLVAHIPASGTAHFYAGVWQSGVWHATDPTSAMNWTNLNDAGIGLPAHTAGTIEQPNGNFDALLVDLCPRNPDRLYVWATRRQCDAMGGGCNEITSALWTTNAPTASWTSIAMTSPPGPAYGFYCFGFRVAPNSPGDGLTDVLFFRSVGFFRSIDSGRNWQGDAIGFHADQQALAFFPESPGPADMPAIYCGCDGGIAMSTFICDRTFHITVAPTDFNHDTSYTNNGIWQNFNHGRQCSAVYQYTSHPAVSALGYVGCQDTGVAASHGALGWTGFWDGDAGPIAAAPGTDGVKVWANMGAYDDWPGFRLCLFTDDGDHSFGVGYATLGAGGPLLATTSNYIVGLDNSGLGGAVVHDSSRTLSAAIAAAGLQAATPSSMAGIVTGTILEIDSGTQFEELTVTATTATTFSANFTKTHAAGVAILLHRGFVGRFGQNGVVSQISQNFYLNRGTVNIVAASPVNADLLVCATNDQRVWTTNAGSTATSATVWTELAGAPAGISITAIAIDNSNAIYVLLGAPVTTGDLEFSTTSPLFRLTGIAWQHQECSGLPGNTFLYGNLVADPVQANTFYASNGARVYRVQKTGGGPWVWTDISDGLPGQWIYDLWIANIAPSGSPKVLLRAAIPTRAVFERDVTAGASTPSIALYVRDHLLDQGWITPSPEGMTHPYTPLQRVWHYQCADVKVDPRQAVAGVAPFFQTDPESSLPINHVIFDQLRDNSLALPAGDAALVHVQARNRSHMPANNVRVWAIYANASAGVPALSASASMGNAFPFWSQFTVTGQIIPALPPDSPWTSVGPPQTLSGITARTPKVASWLWTVPSPPMGAEGHYCMAVFIHSALSGIAETSFNVDSIARTNRQVGQKNLHVGPPLPASGGGGGGGGAPGGAPAMREYVEFHNPTAALREMTLVLDMHALPPQLKVEFQLTKLETAAPLETSISGVANVRKPGAAQKLAGCLLAPLHGILALARTILCMIANLFRKLFDKPLKDCAKKPVAFEPDVYEAAPSATVEVPSIKLPPFGWGAVHIEIRNGGTLPEGSRHVFEVQQRAGHEIVGGSTYIVQISGERPQPPKSDVPAHDTKLPLEELQRIEREAEKWKYIPPVAREIVRKREEEQKRE